MKRTKISEIIGGIDGELVAEAMQHEKSAEKRRAWVKWTAIAACLALVIGGGALAYPLLAGGGWGNNPYGYDVLMPEAALIYPWEYMLPSERYASLDHGGTDYSTIGAAIDANLLGEHLGTGKAEGYDMYDEQRYTLNVEVYAIKGIDPDSRVAVELDGEYYVYRNNAYAPPETLGEFIDSYSLDETVTLYRFSSREGYGEGKYYTTELGAEIWSMLAEHSGAEYMDLDQSKWMDGDTELISFTITSEALGVYKKVMYVTENGYVWTNMCEWGYTFFIGQDAAKKIIAFTEKNSHKAADEPYEYTVAGQITSIADGYVTIDDAVLYRDPSQGEEYKLSMDEMIVKRAVEFAGCEVGDLIVVRYRGTVDASGEVHGISGIDRGKLTDGNEVLIPE